MAEADGPRPWTLAALFGAYFLVVTVAMAIFSMGLTSVWFPANTTMAIYAFDLVAGALLLFVGIGVLVSSGQAALDDDVATMADAPGDELVTADPDGGERMRSTRPSVAAYLAGPALTSLVIVGVSAALLPASDGMLQSLYQLNAFVVLALAYGLGGLAVYVAATFFVVQHRAS